MLPNGFLKVKNQYISLFIEYLLAIYYLFGLQDRGMSTTSVIEFREK